MFDPKVLKLLEELPREHFVPEEYLHLAYADIEIPIGHNQAMMFPRMEGKLLQALDVKPTDQVLEVGTGSGFLTACLARLAQRVVSIDIHDDFIAQARQRLDQQGMRNIQLRSGDALAEPRVEGGPFDAIAITGSLPSMAQAEPFRRQLKPGGRLFVVIGTSPVMEAFLITRHSDRGFTQEGIVETLLPPLEHAELPRAFEF